MSLSLIALGSVVFALLCLCIATALLLTLEPQA